MNPAYTAVVQRDGPRWTGWVKEIPGVNSRAHTRDELLANLRSALTEALEYNCMVAIDATSGSYKESNSPSESCDLLAHLRADGCFLDREGTKHSW